MFRTNGSLSFQRTVTESLSLKGFRVCPKLLFSLDFYSCEQTVRILDVPLKHEATENAAYGLCSKLSPDCSWRPQGLRFTVLGGHAW